MPLKKILTYFERLHTYGLKGVLDFLREKRKRAVLRNFFQKNMKQHSTTPVNGLTLVGNFGGTHSLSKVMRDFLLKLNEANIQFQTFDFDDNNAPARSEVAHLLTPIAEFQLCKYNTIIGMFPSGLFECFPGRRARIVFWEFETGLLEADPALNDGSEIVCMSDFNAITFKKIFPQKTQIHKILYPFLFNPQQKTPADEIRTRYGIATDDFVVFYNFSFNSCYHRKNPYGALKAFATAFKDISNSKLIFKTQGAKSHPDKVKELNSLALELGIADKFISIPNFIPQQEIYSLTNACDVYLSLHRGEGFGLGIAEAMSLGKPVIVTSYSANMEFCNSENSILIPFETMPVNKNEIDNTCYRFVSEWAEPSITAAAKALLALYHDPAQKARIGNNAKLSIAQHFTIEKFKASIADFLGSESNHMSNT